MTAWIDSPAVTVTLNAGTGKSVITGTLRIAFTDAGAAFVTTPDGYHNTGSPALRFRDADWIVGLHLVRAADGTWGDYDGRRSGGINRRGQLGDPPPSYRAALHAAVLHAVAGAWTPEIGRAAAYAHAAQRLHQDEKERDKAAAALAEIDARITALRAVMAANAPQGATS